MLERWSFGQSLTARAKICFSDAKEKDLKDATKDDSQEVNNVEERRRCKSIAILFSTGLRSHKICVTSFEDVP